MATLTIAGSGNTDFTLDTTLNVTGILFNTSGFATAVFLASQFDKTHISQSVQITGDGNSNAIIVALTAPGSFSAAGWSFTNWTIADSLTINGSTGVDTITGGDGAGGNTILGGLGADQLTGGAGPDLFRYLASAEIEAGESINGGSGGFDVIQLNCDGSSYDFSGATISGVEDVAMNFGGATGSATVTFSGSQLTAGGISLVFDSIYTDTVVVVGASVDLSGVTFQNWTNGTDTIKIVGTTGADTLIGSDQDDNFNGGHGKDIFTGGLGADVFDFNLSAESPRGAAHDVILDFHHGQHDRIDLAGIDAKKGHGNQAFHFIGTAHFDHRPGELHYVKHAGFVTVEGDTNGDGKADFQIEVHGAAKLLAGDFVL